MRRTAATLLAALLVGTAGGALAEDAGSRRASEPRDASRSTAESATPDRRGCDKICHADVPIYLPPSRSSTPARVGGGTRGGIRTARPL